MSEPKSLSLAESLALGVKRAREARGKSQDHVAVAAGVHRNQVSRLESGVSGGRNGAPADPHLSTLLKLAAALRVPPAALLFPPDDPTALVEVVPGCPMEMYKAYGWFIGAPFETGTATDLPYPNDGDARSMMGMLHLLELDRGIAAAQMELLQESVPGYGEEELEKLDPEVVESLRYEKTWQDEHHDPAKAEALERRIKTLEFRRKQALEAARLRRERSDG